MSNVFFIGDPHLGHRNIVKFRKYLGFATEPEHREWIMDNWQSVVGNRDKVFVMGDAAFGEDALKEFAKLNGNKVLIRGNHDDGWTAREALTYFQDIHGMLKYKKFWLTHCPIHPNELWGKVNIHGHVHKNSVNDPRYFNVSVENINGTPITFQEIQKRVAENVASFNATGKIKHGLDL